MKLGAPSWARLVLGAGLFVANATGGAFDASAVTRYHLIDGYVVAPQAQVAAAYRLSDAISLGASLGVVNVRVHQKRDVYPILVINGMPTDVSILGGTRPELVLDGSAWAPAWTIAAFAWSIVVAIVAGIMWLRRRAERT